MHKQIRKLNEGFTIVETLIVLAIAALIITIILIAVPDLQRSSRNTDILHDAQNVASGIQTYEGNNGGAIPTAVAIPAGTGVVTITGTGTASTTANVQTGDVISSESYATTATGTAVAWAQSIHNVYTGRLFVAWDAWCSTTEGDATGVSLTPTGEETRSVAVYYPIETSSGSGDIGCIQE